VLLGLKHPQFIETLEDYAESLRKAGRDEEADRLERRATAALDETPKVLNAA
jgi:hypothetical protein